MVDGERIFTWYSDMNKKLKFSTYIHHDNALKCFHVTLSCEVGVTAVIVKFNSTR